MDRSNPKEVTATIKPHTISTTPISHDTKTKLLLTQRRLATVPDDVVLTHGASVENLDLSYNRITDFSWLHRFECLRCLVLDGNRLRESHLERIQGELTNVRLLMMNKNELSDLDTTASILGRVFPALEYLSLHGNPICPDGLQLQPFSGNVSYEYEDYRSRLLRSLPQLKFLDHAPITRPFVGSLPQSSTRVLTFTPKMLWSRLKGAPPTQSYRPLVASPQHSVGYHCGCIRKLSAMDRKYNGAESEGNRFISNSDL